MKKKASNILALCSIALYLSGFWICEIIHGDNMTPWRQLRDTLNGTVIMMLVLLNFLPKAAFKNAVLWAFFILVFGDQVDRWMFNIYDFQANDFLAIGVAAAVFGIKLKGYDTGRGMGEVH